MRKSRDAAIKLIEEKISQFEKILREATCDNLKSDEYKLVYNETRILLSDLFSEAEAKRFDGIETLRVIVSPVDHEKELQDYKKKIKQCIAKLVDYREKIQNFWFNGEILENKNLIERALLLMRFYDEKRIYEIGREMNVPYFSQLRDYSEMSYHRGALEISKSMTDEDLLKLTKDNPPKCKLSLGEFRGKYYTATKEGELTLGSSWENVRKDVQQCFANWDKKAYGVLQAIINKNGTVIDTDIADEIEKILGPGYSWQDLLPRLAQRKLIFNEYNYWKIPPDIIPVIQEELLIYDKSVDIISKIFQKRREINLIFNSKFKTKLFKHNEMASLDMQKACNNEDDFNNKIQVLSTLIDEIETKKLKKDINIDINGSISILEGFLKKNFPGYDEKIVINLRNIMDLRSEKYPIHHDKPEFIKALEYFGFSYSPEWGKLWEVVLKKYFESLELLYELLNANTC